MKKFFFTLGLTALMLMGVNNLQAVTISVDTALAPNAYGSPSYAAWAANAIYAQEHGLSTYGAAGPSQYKEVTGPIGLPVVTGFPSWMNTADPGTAFGPAYANELGNRAHFPFSINGDGTQISISQLGFSASSTDSGDTLAFTFGVGTYNYSSGYIGILAGGDGILGTGDDTYVTSGPNTQLVDAIVGRGSGNAHDIYNSDPGATQQDKIDGVWDKFGLDGSPFDFTGTYTLGDVSGSATFHYNGQSVPDVGATMPLLASAFGLLAFIRRRQF